jgi:hypothetical protein
VVFQLFTALDVPRDAKPHSPIGGALPNCVTCGRTVCAWCSTGAPLNAKRRAHFGADHARAESRFHNGHNDGNRERAWKGLNRRRKQRTLERSPGSASRLATPTWVEGFSIARVLPSARRGAVGAWCFLDHAGPARFAAGAGMRVGPHPHIGLQTFTWMIEGQVLHHDTLGNRTAHFAGAK